MLDIPATVVTFACIPATVVTFALIPATVFMLADCVATVVTEEILGPASGTPVEALNARTVPFRASFNGNVVATASSDSCKRNPLSAVSSTSA